MPVAEVISNHRIMQHAQPRLRDYLKDHIARWSSTLAAAAALTGALAAVALSSPHSPSLCEASASEGRSDSDLDAEAVKTAVHELWLRLDERLHRTEAMLPRGTVLPRLPEPQCIVLDSDRGGKAANTKEANNNKHVIVKFVVPQALDVASATQQVVITFDRCLKEMFWALLAVFY
jgi:hypothetical protein